VRDFSVHLASRRLRAGGGPGGGVPSAGQAWRTRRAPPARRTLHGWRIIPILESRSATSRITAWLHWRKRRRSVCGKSFPA